MTWLLSAHLGEQSTGVEILETPTPPAVPTFQRLPVIYSLSHLLWGWIGGAGCHLAPGRGAGPRVPWAFRLGPGAGVGAHLLRQSEALSDRKTSALHWKVARPSGSGSQLCKLGVTSSTHTA